MFVENYPKIKYTIFDMPHNFMNLEMEKHSIGPKIIFLKPKN
jgi:hypothetical protein